MRIVHVIGSLDPATGGPPMVASRLAAAQAQLGAEVVVAAPAEPGREEATRAAFEAIPAAQRVRRAAVPLARPGELIRGGPARRALEALLRRGDVLHLHGVWEPLLAVAAAAARRRGCPYVVMPHGMLDPWSLRQRRWKKRLAMALGFRAMLDGAAALHALNGDERQLLAPLRLRAPVEVIPNGVFLEEIEPLPPLGSFRADHPELANRPFVLFLSRLHPKKGLDYLADAFAIVAAQRPEVHLVIAGPDGGAREPFERQIEAAGLLGRTHVVGPLYGPDKFAAMVDAARFCLPSRQEGFSVAITEALACGLPAVISEACHFPEVAAAGAGEVVPPERGAIAAALLRVLGDEAARRRMGEAGRALVREKYTWPTIAERTLEMYGRFAPGAAAAPVQQTGRQG